MEIVARCLVPEGTSLEETQARGMITAFALEEIAEERRRQEESGVHVVRIESDGTPDGTIVHTSDGKRLNNVNYLQLVVNANNLRECSVRIGVTIPQGSLDESSWVLEPAQTRPPNRYFYRE